MSQRTKQILKGLAAAIATGAVYGFVLFITVIFALLAGLPIYFQYALWAFGAVTLPSAMLAVSGCLRPKGWRILGTVLLILLLGCGALIAHGVWRDSLPAVDDRTLLLWQYEPFEEGTKAASLEEPASLRLGRWETLRLDGATALYPVYASFVRAVYPEEDYSLSGYWRVACSGTEEAYRRLIRRETDMIFAGPPSQEQLDMAEAAGLELHLTPIGREAFVFFVNSRNPVTDLTVQQIQGIYSGELTNWNQVGGKRQRIRPFQRSKNSGSQTALLGLMDGIPLMEPEQEDVVGAMDGIIHQVADYRNYRNAIGFSFRFYATEMVSSDEIRLLSLNGVAPTREAIRDGSYPLASSFYAVTASRIGQPPLEERNEHAAAFLAWILSDQGQTLVERSGYVAERQG